MQASQLTGLVLVSGGIRWHGLPSSFADSSAWPVGCCGVVCLSMGGEAGVCTAVVAVVATLAVLPIGSVGLFWEDANRRKGSVAKWLHLASDRGTRLAPAGYSDWGPWGGSWKELRPHGL